MIQDGPDSYMIVDGFHRHLVAQQLKMKEVPVVILDDPPSELMAATIRFNRARGTHQIDQMSNIVADLVQMDISDSEIARIWGWMRMKFYGSNKILGLLRCLRIIRIPPHGNRNGTKHEPP